jgi:hypothetical protein
MHHGAISDIAAYDSHAFPQTRINLVKPAMPIHARIERKRSHGGTFTDELFRKMRANKTIGTGDENVLSGKGHAIARCDRSSFICDHSEGQARLTDAG